VPRYFFDIDDGTGAVRDYEGSDLLDIDTAEHEAVETLGQMARDVFRTRGGRQLRVDIRDAMDTPLLRVTLKLTIDAL
jgi:hypothetical protein